MEVLCCLACLSPFALVGFLLYNWGRSRGKSERGYIERAVVIDRAPPHNALETARLREQVDQISRQLRERELPSTQEVERLRGEVRDLALLLHDAKSPQDMQIEHLRSQVQDIRRRLNEPGNNPRQNNSKDA